jgi:uncharacterized cupredoxin-like copper-binding protein
MRSAVAIAAAGLLAVAGCGEKRENTGTGAAGGGAPTTVAVSETEFKLSPSKANVPGPGPVTFRVTNDGKTTHALEVETPAGELKTPPIAPGKRATLKGDLKSGTYDWYCPIDGHKAKGMKGTVVVGKGDSSGGGSSGGGY